MHAKRIIVVGAGVAGLVAALELAANGLHVTLLESAATPGGKMREVAIGAQGHARMDAGPTVFTMRWVFDELFADVGASLDDHLELEPLEILARHAWSADERLDLHASLDDSIEAIAAFAGRREADGYREFAADARRMYDLLERPFMTASRPSIPSLIARMGLPGLMSLRHIQPHITMWNELGRYFRDPRLQQLFARYATYCGSSPFAAPATLMLIAHVEQQGVWSIRGGMHKLAATLAALATRHGATIRYGAKASQILSNKGCVTGVRLASGEDIAAEAVICNADAAALACGLLGDGMRAAVPGVARSPRSLSAVTFAFEAEATGFPLVRHNVFFPPGYQAEFSDIFESARTPRDPTVYLCAQDRSDDHRGAGGRSTSGPPERMLCLINAPATGDTDPYDDKEIARCEENLMRRLAASGLNLKRQPGATTVTTPRDFNRLFPGRGGALYGAATHGLMASFRRPASETPIRGLFLAGGSVHPGPGVPMAAISGRLAARCVLKSLASTRTSRRVAMRGGMSTA